VKIYTLICDRASVLKIYADSYGGSRLRNDPWMQTGTFRFYKHEGCLRGRRQVFSIEARRVLSLTERDCPPEDEKLPGGYVIVR
jgi:hypothetical protein